MTMMVSLVGQMKLLVNGMMTCDVIGGGNKGK